MIYLPAQKNLFFYHHQPQAPANARTNGSAPLSTTSSPVQPTNHHNKIKTNPTKTSPNKTQIKNYKNKNSFMVEIGTWSGERSERFFMRLGAVEAMSSPIWISESFSATKDAINEDYPKPREQEKERYLEENQNREQ